MGAPWTHQAVLITPSQAYSREEFRKVGCARARDLQRRQFESHTRYRGANAPDPSQPYQHANDADVRGDTSCMA